jgi:hypothetical protein
MNLKVLEQKITWQGGTIDDVEILRELPEDLVSLLEKTNGFILHHGAFHLRGATLMPEWHSIRVAWRGSNSFQSLYTSVLSEDVPFAQDQFGDQFLIRDGKIVRLLAEMGRVELIAENLEEFLSRVCGNLEEFLNVTITRYPLMPGQLLHAYPPFCFQESGASASINSAPAQEVIRGNAEIARVLRDVPAGGKVEFRVINRERGRE